MNYILSYLSAFVFAIVGILLGATVIPSEPTLLIVLTSLSILPLFLLIFNVFAAKRYVKKIRQTNVEDMNTYMQSHRKEAEETSRVLLLKLQHLRRTALALNLTVAFFAILSAVLAGLLFFVNKHLAIIFHVYSYFLFCTVFSRIYKDEKISKIYHANEKNIKKIDQLDKKEIIYKKTDGRDAHFLHSSPKS